MALGPALRRAWVGYQLRLDAELAAAGFVDRGFPDTRVLLMCADSAGTTTSQIGRELGITRQGASKVTASLRDRGYVTIEASPTNGREKVVALTPRAVEYLAAQTAAVRAVDEKLRLELGADGLADLHRLLEIVRGADDPRTISYVRRRRQIGGLSPSDG